jgi:DNA-binding CsgD family transcriptional regulator
MEKLITAKELAQFLKLSESTIYNPGRGDSWVEDRGFLAF